uniref:Hum s 3 allergen n=1 Tax=Humulus scandens TaxID=228586 RepID=A0A6J3WUE7_HUMSC|nr:Hum s 3 allergen [Humulus scandens]
MLMRKVTTITRTVAAGNEESTAIPMLPCELTVCHVQRKQTAVTTMAETDCTNDARCRYHRPGPRIETPSTPTT